MTSKWGHAKVADSGPTSVVTLGNLIECLSPLIKTNNNRSLHDIYATHTIYNKSSPAVESDLQILVSNLSGATLLSWLTLGKQAQILLQRFKRGFDSAGTQGSLFLWPCVYSQFWTYKTWRKKHQVSQTLCGPLNSILDLQIEAVYVPPGFFLTPFLHPKIHLGDIYMTFALL